MLNWTSPNWNAQNWTTRSQTKACSAKLSCEICALLGYFVVYSGNSLPTFWVNFSIPSSRIKKSKREQGMTEFN
jgi:hypothetical protein